MEVRYEACVRKIQYQVNNLYDFFDPHTGFLSIESIQVRCFDLSKEEQCSLIEELVRECTVGALGEI